jgi:hypothetical protein
VPNKLYTSILFQLITYSLQLPIELNASGMSFKGRLPALNRNQVVDGILILTKRKMHCQATLMDAPLIIQDDANPRSRMLYKEFALIYSYSLK